MKIDPIGRKPDSEERGFLFVGQGINVEFSEWPRVEVQGSSSLKSRYSCLQDKELDVLKVVRPRVFAGNMHNPGPGRMNRRKEPTL